jgi:hypothetical protein
MKKETLKKLPIGVQTFTTIRDAKENYLYIDKTSMALELINSHKYYFLSRPRRFGKSLFIDTLHNIFEGNQALFEGLYIHDKYDWTQSYPVIKISWAGDFSTAQDTKEVILAAMRENQKRLGVTCETTTNYALCFKELIASVHEKYKQKVVVLIDEYDKPILDALGNSEVAKANRDILRSLYVMIKESDQYLQFAFLTGVSKFSKASIFSGLNNLDDISLDARYGNICGYTQEEIETQFMPYLEGVDLEELKLWYNGYNFLGDKVYNPFDILLFIQKGKLYRNYWFETGTPTFLINLIKEKEYFLPSFEQLEVEESLTNSFDIDKLSIETLMFQTGYLTIKKMRQLRNRKIKYRLGFPNLEVQMSFFDYILNNTVDRVEKSRISDELWEIFEEAKLDQLEDNLKRLFASIAYNNHTNNTLQNYEGFYASVLYAYFSALGVELIAEDVTNRGRVDLTIKLDNRVYIFEFKVTNENPLEQIKAKQYYQKYSGEIYIIGIRFNTEARNIEAFVWENVTV